MDGTDNIILMSGVVEKKKSDKIPPMFLFFGTKPPKLKNKKSIYVKIMDWSKNKTINFKDLSRN